MRQLLCLLFIVLLLPACSDEGDPAPSDQKELLQLQSVKIGGTSLSSSATTSGVATDMPILLRFSDALNTDGVSDKIALENASGQKLSLTINLIDQNQTISSQPASRLANNETYTLQIAPLENATGTSEFPGATYRFTTRQVALSLLSATIDEKDFPRNGRVDNIDPNFTIRLNFEQALEEGYLNAAGVEIRGNNGLVPVSLNLADEHSLLISPQEAVSFLARFTFSLTPSFYSDNGLTFGGFTSTFYTQADPAPKFPLIAEAELLTKVQEQTFRYFWDFAHPVSGLARERTSSGELVTIGGSGFGIMGIPVAIERGFISREEGINRLATITTFLEETADRFHGVWPHWLNGSTGKVIPFSQFDDGGDLVETAFMIQGLLTIRQYLNPASASEAAIIATINRLWESVEWDWYTQGGQQVLYWHWSPNYAWQMNHQIRGYNEALIVYVLAASSPTHPISPEVYHEGWAQNGSIKNGQSYYGYTLPLGTSYGGPLFFAHYSFLGLDPRKLEDRYANYWTQNVNHSLINQAYVIDNPKNWVGYSAENWGLTASDNQEGYSAHSPTNDLGVITPTAAISSLPYTPEASLAALNYFYYTLGDKLWGDYGFYDAFNLTLPWFAKSYLAIDQGPIVVMIENYRTQLLWNLFMSNPEIEQGLQDLDFSAY